VSFEPTRLELCFHCGNQVHLTRLAIHAGRELFDHLGGKRIEADFNYHSYQCPTCNGVTLYGDFTDPAKTREEAYRRIYPEGHRLLPEIHQVASRDCVPKDVVQLYEDCWMLRHISPAGFVVQIRTALEMICDEQGVREGTLAERLGLLAAKEVLPGRFVEMTKLMREVGNFGAHHGPVKVNFWEAEQIDEFFRLVVEYVYVLPARMRTLRRRLKSR
jgi:hypothetical protein